MKIALIGYGKMGKLIEQIALSRNHEIVCVVDIDNQDDIFSPAFKSADVAIEFTSPSTAFENVKKAFAAGVKVVSGSTGWFDDYRHEIEAMCDRGGTLFWSSNFSLGVAIFSSVNRYLAKIMAGFDAYDVRMSETHHVHKLDAPSGTAITLAQDILEAVPRKTGWVKGDFTAPDGHVTLSEPARDCELVIDSVRKGEVPGIHSVTYSSPSDEILIQHNAKNRSGFALGAVLAAEYACHHQGLLSMEDLFPFLND